MKTYTVVYESVLSFHFFPTEEINRAKTILIQIFSHQTSRSVLEKIAQEVNIFFPKAVIVGQTVAGAIYHETYSTSRTIVTITTFEKTHLKCHAVEFIEKESAYDIGRSMAKKVMRNDTKMLLLLCDGLGIDAQSLCEGIRKTAANVPIVGTLAADGGKFFETMVLMGEKVYPSGAVVVSLSGSRFTCAIRTFSKMVAVGPVMEITRAEGNLVSTVDHEKAARRLGHYLGRKYVENLPLSSFDIALLSSDNIDHEEGSRPTIRHILQSREDGALAFAGSLPVGSRWRFGYLDTESEILLEAPVLEKERMAQSHWIFCDLAILRNLPDHLYGLIDLLSHEAPVTGAVGYGEFSGDTLANQSFVVVSMTESDERATKTTLPTRFTPHKREERISLAEALAHLATTMFEENTLRDAAYRRLVEEQSDGLIVYDRHLHIRTANEIARQLLGLDVKTEESGGVEGLEKWLIALMKDGLNKDILSRVGHILDPRNAKSLEVLAETTPIERQGDVIGAFLRIRPLDRSFQMHGS